MISFGGETNWKWKTVTYRIGPLLQRYWKKLFIYNKLILLLLFNMFVIVVALVSDSLYSFQRKRFIFFILIYIPIYLIMYILIKQKVSVTDEYVEIDSLAFRFVLLPFRRFRLFCRHFPGVFKIWLSFNSFADYFFYQR